MALTPRQTRFIEEYLIDLNGTQAAIRAGYSAKSARQHANRMMTNAAIQAALSERQKARAERAELTGDMVIEELRLLAFANLGYYFDAQLAGNPKLLTLDQTAALQESTVDIVSHEVDAEGKAVTVRRIRFKLAEKRPALVDLGRHLGVFPAQQHEHLIKIPVAPHQQLLDELATIRARNQAMAKTNEKS